MGIRCDRSHGPDLALERHKLVTVVARRWRKRVAQAGPPGVPVPDKITASLTRSGRPTPSTIVCLTCSRRRCAVSDPDPGELGGPGHGRGPSGPGRHRPCRAAGSGADPVCTELQPGCLRQARALRRPAAVPEPRATGTAMQPASLPIAAAAKAPPVRPIPVHRSTRPTKGQRPHGEMPQFGWQTTACNRAKPCHSI
jgi:hypothetical protein